MSTAKDDVAGSPAGAAAWTGQLGEPTRLILLRHGQTVLSAEHRYSGHGDPELTDVGQAQAAAAAARLASVPGITAVLTSPLGRARQTASAVAAAAGAPLEVRPGLIETDFGEWEGLTFREARERYPHLHARWVGATEVAPPGGESFDDVAIRVAEERAKIVAEFRGRTVVVVSHVTPIKLIVQQALGAGPSILFRLHLDLASLCVADFYADGGSSVRLVNDTAHLVEV